MGGVNGRCEWKCVNGSVDASVDGAEAVEREARGALRCGGGVMEVWMEV
jgi:hypothetical protein